MESVLAWLQNEIWTEITRYLSTEEIYSFKFLCKRFFKIALMHKKIKYFTVNSHKIFDINDYYNTFFYVRKSFKFFLKKN